MYLGADTVMCTLHDFHCSKVKFIHTILLLVHNLVREKTTCTPRVRLVFLETDFFAVLDRFCHLYGSLCIMCQKIHKTRCIRSPLEMHSVNIKCNKMRRYFNTFFRSTGHLGKWKYVGLTRSRRSSIIIQCVFQWC